jgi:hypothetical protein
LKNCGKYFVTDNVKNFVLGVVATTLLIVCALYLIGLAAVNAKREACTKFADITGQQTTFITYGLTDSLCFTNINGSWTDINPNKVNP